MRNSKSINLFADVIAPFGVVAVTVALFFVFIPNEPGTLFWTNMVYSAFLEIILFAYIVWLPSRGDSVALKWMFGTYSLIYICISVVWMLLFSLVLCHWWPVKAYFAVIAVLTVLWILAGALSLKVDNTNEVSVAALSANRMEADRITIEADMLLRQFEMMASSNPGLAPASASVTTLCRGLSTLSPVVMADPDYSRRVREICSGLEEILERPADEKMPGQLKDYADRSLIKLNSIKKSIRK